MGKLYLVKFAYGELIFATARAAFQNDTYLLQKLSKLTLKK